MTANKTIPIIPIHRTPDERTRVLDVAERIKSDLADVGIDAEVDDRDLRPGLKFYEWEVRGADLRIEIGPKDLECGEVLVRHLDGEGTRVAVQVPVAELTRYVQSYGG